MHEIKRCREEDQRKIKENKRYQLSGEAHLRIIKGIGYVI